MSTGSYRDAPAGPASPPSAARHDHRRALGRLGEDLAAAHLRREGFSLLARNARTRFGEIDLIAFDGSTIVFAEVKCRRMSAARVTGGCWQPLAGLGPRKRTRLRRLATAWLTDTDSRPTSELIRFDAIGVTVDGRDQVLELEHLEGAW